MSLRSWRRLVEVSDWTLLRVDVRIRLMYEYMKYDGESDEEERKVKWMNALEKARS